MEKITFDNAKVGMRVLLQYPDTHYEIGSSNPAVGTKYECSGVIKEILDGEEICVNWENKRYNSYKENELVSADNAGVVIDLWREM